MSHDPGPGFRALHRPGDPFVLANAWDIGSARMLAALGAEAIGTSSAGHAFTLGAPDGHGVTRDMALAHAEDLVAATQLPVSADLEDGYGAAPETCAETVRLAAEVGLAGLSIEDTALPGTSAHPKDLAVERIRAAAAAARALPRDIVVVARADGMLTGSYGFHDALARVIAFADAGADCVYIPLPGGLAELARICSAVTVPVNALAVGPLAKQSHSDFAASGVARISLGSALARVAHRALHDAAVTLLQEGDFSPLANGMPGRDVDELLLKAAR